MRIVTDQVDRFIRAIIRENTEFVGGSIRYSAVNLEQSILVAIGKMDSGENIDRAVHSFLFRKEEFNFDSVVDWLDETKGDKWDKLEVEFKSLQEIEITNEMAYKPKSTGGNEMGSHLKEIKEVPIFKLGVHNENKFKDQDLDEMIKNFNSLKKENPDFQIPIKLGHDAFSDSEKPAVGWMENLRRSGEFIVADFVDLSRDAFELIKNKTFKNRSIEIIPEFINSLGKKIGKVIKGIALLGSSLPAVNLPDIKLKKALAFAEGQKSESYELDDNEYFMSDETKDLLKEAHEFVEENKEDYETYLKLKEMDKGFRDHVQKTKGVTSKEDQEFLDKGYKSKEVSKMDEIVKLKEELKKEKEKLSVLNDFSNSKDIINSLNELKVLKSEKEEIYKELLKEKEKKDNDFVEGLIKDNKILPKNKNTIINIFSSIGEGEISEVLEFGQKKETKLKDMFRELLTELPDRGLLTEHSRTKTYKHADRKIALSKFVESKGYSEKEYKKLTIHDTKKILAEFSQEYDKEEG